MIKEFADDPFESHPFSGTFIEAAFVAREQGEKRISKQRREELAASFSMDVGEAAAFAYLADKRVDEFSDELDLETMKLETGGQP